MLFPLAYKALGKGERRRQSAPYYPSVNPAPSNPASRIGTCTPLPLSASSSLEGVSSFLGCLDRLSGHTLPNGFGWRAAVLSGMSVNLGLE